MTKTQYELDRDERVRDIEEHFKSLGIPILPQEVRDVMMRTSLLRIQTTLLKMIYKVLLLAHALDN